MAGSLGATVAPESPPVEGDGQDGFREGVPAQPEAHKTSATSQLCPSAAFSMAAGGSGSPLAGGFLWLLFLLETPNPTGRG